MGIPLVALAGQQPQITDPQTLQMNAARIQGLRGQNALQPGELQEQQQRIQSQDLAIQQQKRDLADRDAMTKSMQEWDGKDYGTLPDLMKKHGASFNAVMGTKTALIKQQTDLSNLSKDQLAIEKIKNDYSAQELDNVKQLPPEQQAQAFEEAKARIVAKGYMDAQHAQALTYQNPQQLDMLEKAMMGHGAALTAAEKQATINKEQQAAAESGAKLPGEVAESTQKAQEAALGPQGRAQMKLLGEPAALEMNDWLKKHPGKGPADYGKYKATLVPAFNFNLQGGNSQVSPDDPTVQLVASGKMKIGEALTPRTPLLIRRAFVNAVVQVNPDFDTKSYDIEKGVEKKFTSGNVSDQLMAIGTAREHMKTFSRLADALDNGDVQAVNKLGNALGVQFGSDKATNFRIASQAFGGEVGKAFDGAGVVAGEREQAQKSFNDAMSKEQFKGAIQTVDELLAGKQRAAKIAYDTAKTGKPNFGNGADAAGSSSGGLKVGDAVKIKGKSMKVTAVHPDGSFDAQ